MKENELNIRLCREEDHAVMIAIANRAFRKARKFTRAELGDTLCDLVFPGGDDRSKGEEVRKFLEAHPDQAIVAESQGQLVGFATWIIAGKIGIIGNNGADPDHHVPGTGTRMYQELLKIFRAHGCAAARVLTGMSEEFAPARKAYQKAGFKRRIESVTYYMDLTENCNR